MTQADEKIICPVCQHENPPEAKQCEQCKAPLGNIVGTVPVSDVVPEPVDLSKTHDISAGYKSELRGGALALHVAGQPQPIIIKGLQEEIVLGRRVADETPPTVDLSEFHAHLLGVSRRHAVIRKKDGQFTLEDLNSSNGTWLNENRLPASQPQPLQHGDQIRLGQLIIFVYFTSIQAIKLIERNDQTPALARRRITPRYVVEQVGPYLRAIEDLQTIVDELQGRPPVEIGLGSLIVGSENALNVTLENAVEAIRWIQTKITPWRKQHADVIARLRGVEPAHTAGEAPPPQTTGEVQPPQTTEEAPPVQPTGEVPPAQAAKEAPPAIAPEQQEFENHLAKELIGQVARVISPETTQTYIQKLLPTLHTLLFSTLEISEEV
jgi:pSer/pThr/pTyr-binding forkhead associated (FHA) protein